MPDHQRTGTPEPVADAEQPATKTLDPVEDRKRWTTLDRPVQVDRVACLKHAGKSGEGSWLGKWLRTNFGPGGLTPDEFLYYRLYRNHLSADDRARYVGKRAQNRGHFACNSHSWLACAHDKLLYHTILHAHGLPAPELRAVYTRATSRTAPWRYLRDDRELEAYLRSPDSYPVFAKPVQGMYSIGAMLLQSVDGDEVVLGKGRRVPIDQLVAYIEELDEHGYLFQTPLSIHESLSPALGDALPAARMMVLLDGDKQPRIPIATLKLPLAQHDADNFWRTGNMVAPIDLESGTIDGAITGFAHETRPLKNHPETGASLEGLSLPDWAGAKRLVLEASRHFPEIRTQGWDVCFSSNGPVLLELNFGGDLNLHQLAHDRGMYDEEYCAHMRDCGYRRKLPDA